VIVEAGGHHGGTRPVVPLLESEGFVVGGAGRVAENLENVAGVEMGNGGGFEEWYFRRGPGEEVDEIALRTEVGPTEEGG
jgi:hypothetical protein